ncbi:hypothetical protein [Larkinella arboricola]|uniref:Uncharacterized protein n=1 Tax=Larkinella arboricola TaxID=643671 RepID=A0A327X8U9_LARAB|nr:hypothetical protein [Larkinella arboricola]RAK03129.1 hypothetical protein LX87_01251 [Larkinella arboricola]
MKKVSYDSIKADQAWLTVAQHLQRRNQLIAEGIYFLEKHPADHSLVGRLVVIQYHLRSTIRQLVNDTSAMGPVTQLRQQVKQQWMMVHQVTFLLRQIDDELAKIGVKSPVFRSWMHLKQTQFSYKAPVSVQLN